MRSWACLISTHHSLDGVPGFWLTSIRTRLVPVVRLLTGTVKMVVESSSLAPVRSPM